MNTRRTTAWTTTAVTQDDTGLFLVGAILVFVGLPVGTTVVSLLTTVVRRRVLKEH